ncbi:MAG: SDR family oxidoreductase [Bacteroidales bacterium]|nr:SDR family oxidoreductase [Bacteroidales bacterium]
MSKFKNKLVLITGGASGIGKIMGRIALQKGAKLVIWDINQLMLDATTAEFSNLGEVYKFIVDVSSPEQIQSAAENVRTNIGIVDILINNAGIVIGKYFDEHSYNDIKRTMDINTIAPMLITNEFLPAMKKQNFGHICNIASSAGLISNPKMSVYVASKWAAIGWSDSLRLEMKQLHQNIGVTTVTPYYINTGMFDGVKSIVPILKPEKVAKKVIRGIERNLPFVSMPWSMRFVRFGQGVMPIWFFDWFIGGVMGIYKTMEHFEGHKNK